MKEGEDVILGNENIYQVGRFAYLFSNISKDDGCQDDVKIRIAKAQGIFIYRAKIKVGRPRMGWEDVARKDLREIGCKEGGLE